MGLWHGFLEITGTSNEGGLWYGWWSGFGADLTEFAIFAIVWRKINCHAKGCFRVGMHHVDGTPYTTCRKHHPVHRGSRAATADEIAAAHLRGLHRRHEESRAEAGEQATAVERDVIEEAAAERSND